MASNEQATPPPPAREDQIVGTPACTVMTAEYAATLARFAYVWGWPLVNNLNRSIGVKDLPGPGRVGGVIPATPPGHVSMLTDYISAEEHYVTCPNQDTVYGASFQRTDTIPVVIQVPDFGTRFYTYQSRTRARTRLVRLVSSTGQSRASMRSWDRIGRGPYLQA